MQQNYCKYFEDRNISNFFINKHLIILKNTELISIFNISN